jgi:heterodisulfide reductase subunit E
MEEGIMLFGREMFGSLFVSYKIMVPVAILSVILFIVGIIIHLRKWGIAVPEEGQAGTGACSACKSIIEHMFKDGVGKVVEVLILDVFLQRRVFRLRKLQWVMHMLIFWGWFGMAILTAVAFIAEVRSPEIFARTWLNLEPLNNLLGGMLVVGIAIAMVRRLFVREKDVQARNADVDWILLIGLLVVVVTGFAAQDIRMAAGIAARAPVSSYGDYFNSTVTVFHEVFTLLFCVAYIPYSKYFHMLAAPLALLVNRGGYPADGKSPRGEM